MSKRKENENNPKQSKKIKFDHNDSSNSSMANYIGEYKTKIDELLDNNFSAENLSRLKQLIKKNVEIDIKPKYFKHILSFYSFQKICTQLIKLNQISKTSNIINDVITDLLDTISYINIENFSTDDLYAIFESFINQLVKINYLNNSIADVMSKIGKHLSSCSKKCSMNINKLLVRLIDECVFDETYMLSLLQFLIKMYCCSNGNIVQLIFKKIFNKNSNQENLRWSPENLPILIKNLLDLISIYSIENYEKIYKNIIKILMKIDINKDILNKQQNLDILKNSIDFIANHLIINDKRDSVNNEFFKSIKSFFENCSINPLTSHFFASLSISLASSENIFVKNKVIDLILKNFEMLAEAIVYKRRTEWINSSFKQNVSLKDLLNMFKHNLLIRLLDSDRLVYGILNISMKIIATYGVEMNYYAKDPINIEEHLSLFVSEILEDLFMYSKNGREKIITALIEKCFELNLSNRGFFYQLEKLLKSKTCLKIYIDSSNQVERCKISNLILSHLNGDSQSCAKKSLRAKDKLSKNKPPLASFYNDITKFERFDDSIRILEAVSLFIFTDNKTDKNRNFNNLIELLKLKIKSSHIIENQDLIKLKVSCLIKIIKCLNKNHFNGKDNNDLFFIHDYNRIRNKYLLDNFQSSLLIFNYLKSLLDNESIESHVKSSIYQSFSQLIKLNPNLTEYITEFLFKKLVSLMVISRRSKNSDEYIERHANLNDHFLSSNDHDSLLYLNIEKCISVKNESNIVHCTEPIDVILNCADICLRTSSKLTQSQTMNIQSFNKLNLLIKSISKTYLTKDAKQIYDIYKNQLNKNNLIIDPSYLKLTHQIECGILDSLLEYLIESQQYNDVTKILERFESTENCLFHEIDSLIIEKQQLKHLEIKNKMTNKRKMDTDSTTIKKQKLNINDENQDSQKFSIKEQTTKKRIPFSDITSSVSHESNSGLLKIDSETINTTQQSQTSKTNNNIISFFNIKLDRTPRISYSCSLKLFELTLCSSDKGNVMSSRVLNEINSLTVLVSLITSQKLIDYSHYIIEKKLNALSDCYNDEHYDPENLESNELFDYLSNLWVLFFQRINAPDHSELSLYKPNITERFCNSFFLKTQCYINYCKTIWSLVNKNFQINRDALIRNERERYEPNDDDLWRGYTNDNQIKKNRVYWKFLSFCLKTIKSHLSPSSNSCNIAIKIIKSMFSLINDVLNAIELEAFQYENLSEWLYEFSNNDLVSDDEELTLFVIKLLNNVTNKKFFNSTFLKYLSIDYFNQICINDNKIEEIAENDIYLLEFTRQFSLIKNENMLKFITTEIDIIFEKCSWVLNNLRFCDTNMATEFIIYQLENVTIILSSLLKCSININTSQLILKRLSTFYQFLRKFIKINLLNRLDEDILVLVKRLLSLISSKLQSCFQKEFSRIKDFINSNLENDNSEQQQQQAHSNTNEDDIIKLFKYREYFVELIKSIELFEIQLSMLKHIKKEWSLMKIFGHSIKDLKIKFEIKITRILSPEQLDEIMYKFQ